MFSRHSLVVKSAALLTVGSFALGGATELISRATSSPETSRAEQQLDHARAAKRDITGLQLLQGTAAIIPGAIVEGAGAMGVVARHWPRGVYEGYRGLYHTKEIGPKLKTLIGTVGAPVAVATPFLAGIGGAAVGGVRGGIDGYEEGFLASLGRRVDDLRFLNDDLGKGLDQVAREIDRERDRPATKEPFDISLMKAGEGLVGAAAGAVIDGVGVTGLTLRYWPQGVYNMYRSLYQDESIGPKLKTLYGALGAFGAVAAPPGAVVGGTLYGLGAGAYDGYKKGIAGSIQNRVEDLKQFNELAKDFVEHSRIR